MTTTTTRELTILTNDFHNTSVRTRKTRDELDRLLQTDRYDRTDAENAFVRRVRNALCGVKGCECSNDLGER